VNWSGTDVGAGIASYTISVSTNGGPWGVWLDATNSTSSVFVGQNGKTYGFFSTARDQVGNVEAPPVAADATTTISLPGDLSLAITASLQSGGQTTHVVLTFPVSAGFNHVVEYRDSVTSGPEWQPLPGAPHNSGIVVDDAVIPERYYRVRRTAHP
jgi:hypothetical protein